MGEGRVSLLPRAQSSDPDLPEGTSPARFSFGGRPGTSSTWKRLTNSSEPWLCRTISPRRTTVWARMLAHIGLLEHAREMYERARPFHPRKAVSRSIVQVYVWNQEYDLAREEIEAWRAETPENKYPVYFAVQLALLMGDLPEAKTLLDEALQLLPEEPLIVTLQGVYYASTGLAGKALDCPDGGLCEPKILWACSPQLLSNRLHTCNVGAASSCV